MFVCTGRFGLFYFTKNAETRRTRIHTYTHTFVFFLQGLKACFIAWIWGNRHKMHMDVCEYRPFRLFLPYEKFGNAPYTRTHIHAHFCFLFPRPQTMLYAYLDLGNRQFLHVKNPLFPEKRLGAGLGSPKGAVHTNTQTPYTQTHKPRTHKHTNLVHTKTQT